MFQLCLLFLLVLVRYHTGLVVLSKYCATEPCGQPLQLPSVALKEAMLAVSCWAAGETTWQLVTMQIFCSQMQGHSHKESPLPLLSPTLNFILYKKSHSVISKSQPQSHWSSGWAQMVESLPSTNSVPAAPLCPEDQSKSTLSPHKYRSRWDGQTDNHRQSP